MTAKRILALLTALWLTVSIPVNALAAERPSETAVEGTETLPEEVPAEESPSEEAAPRSQTDSGTCGDNLTWTLDAEGTLTISGTGEMSSDPWNPYRSDIKKVVIESGVTSICDEAFRNCTGMTSVTIPESITLIGTYAFMRCTSLASVTIPKNVTMSGSVFGYCKLLTSAGPIGGDYDYQFGWTEAIPSNAFAECSNLTSVTIPESVTSIGKSAFRGCSKLQSITIPENVMSIGASAFWHCISLLTVNIPKGVTSIQDFTFGGCLNLPSVTIPDNVTSIGEEAFIDCESLTDLTIPKRVTSIGREAFEDCISLTSVTIPESVTSIGQGAFLRCTGLTSVTIPESVATLEVSAFKGCAGLTSAGPIGSGCSYQFGWTEKIPAHAFYGCSGLTSVTIPESVTSIGKLAFLSCTNLARVTIPGSVTSIDESAFNDCPNLCIFCYPDSYAETYAIKYGISYAPLSISDDEVVTWLTSNVQNGVSSGIDFLIHTGWSAQKTASSVKLDLPSQVTLSSIWLDGTELDASSYTLVNGQLTVPLDALSNDRPAHTLYLYCCATAGGSYRISGELTMEDNTTHDPGSVVIQVEDVQISVPEKVGAAKGIVASGKTAPELPVTLFVDGTAAGESTANDAGSWWISFDLPETETESSHTIYAEIELKSGEKVQTEKTWIVYRANETKPVKVTMYNTSDQGAQETVFDFTKPETANQIHYYRFWSLYPSFTFRAEFEGREPSIVYIVTENNEGKTTKIPASYDARTKSWVGSHNYISFQNAPSLIYVTYEKDGFSSNKLPAVCIMDPSGYVYEAVPSNRLSGVTATISCESDGGGDWDAGRFDQTNPQLTGADGSYYWDVPAGKWKVTFTKEGYVTTDTTEIAKAAGHEDGWLPVPPPQTEINAPMVSTAPPEVKYAAVYEDRAEITFSQYMDIDSVKGAVTLNGAAANVEALDAEDNADKTARYATRFKASAEGLNGNVALTVSTDAKNYAGNRLEQAYTETFSVEIRPTEMTAPDKVSVQMNGSQKISVTLEPADSERTLAIENLTPAIMQTETEVTTDNGGVAEITVEALLPGTGILRISEPRSGLTKTVSVQVEAAETAELFIKASISGGVLTYEVMNPPTGINAKLYAAGYQGQRMTGVIDLAGLSGTRTLTDTAADSYNLFLVDAETWVPLCPKATVEITAGG